MPSTAQTQLQFIQTNYGTPDQYVWAVAIAPYVYLPTGDDVAGLTLNQLFADLNQSLNASFIPNVKANAAVAARYNLPLVAYEGNTVLTVAKGVNAQVKLEAQSDPRLFQFDVAMLNAWNTYAGSNSLYMDYELTSFPGDVGYYNALQSVTDAGSKQYDAILSEMLAAGDANRDGTVNFADFQILEQNYGFSNASWSEGDFNGDGVVNWSDLNALRTDLDPTGMTPSQFAQSSPSSASRVYSPPAKPPSTMDTA